MTAVWQIVALAIVAGVLVVAAVWLMLGFRVNPENRERQRRLIVDRRGRLADGIVTEANATTLYYSYEIAGVAYTTSQDISSLYGHLPADPERLIGPVTLKYTPKNPANSIVLCETWSGLRIMRRL